jgi:hypothetical protein
MAKKKVRSLPERLAEAEKRLEALKLRQQRADITAKLKNLRKK